MSEFGKLLVLIGAFILVLGLGIQGLEKWFNFGHLPGDIYIRKGSFKFYFPIISCAIISLIVSFLLSIFGKR
ncbi:MAG: hypothetical protein A3G33_00055 [Omnitrophica bacterium RIFCSPLOWO2_12_FULL_44_17]|uniref:DUF2905 domain-containing protein n=1 Tax=Candidatus Danuiimicrobium aquiferis TaxID=1801832 RepID=A0A1G1KSP2_9BACT|nr:MAG: hypothetical protein A3B72_10165 [Omnitrophica bacterium RIFCSPHIGHO2_02_FULL_45_28]OGW88278.1 MAG: hypothetical protein A3E74_10480 [Omnitrophica bacterium RIFCSPHIGHO2_12_FULL_44_12]OGW95973.1 MAG: hypothetical protein A3G33_00055 [Omnitrophica bacterium RIFCSPLOWO2_12_FULL_44_17]OGX01967.1 MAG: hypothetical protein A3J12_04635 [Omnitrophica bacterium RIFCSPLOWO2_02_FULL_44_11]